MQMLTMIRKCYECESNRGVSLEFDSVYDVNETKATFWVNNNQEEMYFESYSCHLYQIYPLILNIHLYK